MTMDEQLSKSIAQYRAIIEHAQQLEVLLNSADPLQLTQYTTRLNDLQQEAGLNDQRILQRMAAAADAAAWKAHPLFQERMQLLKQIMEMNDLLLPRIRGMMSVTAAELAQLKEGRVAFSGYHPSAPKAQSSLGVG